MAEITTECCAPAAQETCCEPSEKASCCGDSHLDGCGCSAGSVRASTTATVEEVRETVREKYAAAAVAAASGSACCGLADAAGVFGGSLYAGTGESDVPEAAINASLGCGVPTAVADLHEGETVLDLGSGAGADVLISARRVGPTGKAIGLDMTDEMLDLARANARDAGVENVEFLKGYLEDIPVGDETVDVVISNCVINLSGDKPSVIRETARVLRPGGRFAVSDVIADPDIDEQTRADMAAWTGCVAGALTNRSSDPRFATPASRTSRFGRPIVCTSGPPRRSSGLASPACSEPHRLQPGRRGAGRAARALSRDRTPRGRSGARARSCHCSFCRRFAKRSAGADAGSGAWLLSVLRDRLWPRHPAPRDQR